LCPSEAIARSGKQAIDFLVDATATTRRMAELLWQALRCTADAGVAPHRIFEGLQALTCWSCGPDRNHDHTGAPQPRVFEMRATSARHDAGTVPPMRCFAMSIALVACNGSRVETTSPGSVATGSAATGSAAHAPAPATSQGSAAPQLTQVWIDKVGMDTAVKPGDDFFKYANGAWLAATDIPADRASWGADEILTEHVLQQNRDLIADAIASAKPDTEARKVADYYAAFMDEAAIEAKGVQPLASFLADIAKIGDAKALATELGATLRADVDVLNASNTYTSNLLGLWIAQDLDDPSRYAPFVLQGGLGMPDREYYVDPAPRMADLRAKYLAHVAAQLKNGGIADAAGKAKRIVELETKIARVHATRTETDDVHAGDNHWKKADFATKAPGLDWDTLFATAGLDQQADFVVWQPKAVAGIAALVKSEPLATWKDWLVVHEIDAMSDVLPKAFADESFAFFRTALLGVPKQAERWKLGIDATTKALGEAVGKLYIAKHFPPEAKAKAQAMVKNELTAFAARIDKLDWMAASTKTKAKAKLAALKVGVGYPDTWVSYAGLEVKPDDAYGNAARASRWDTARKISRLGQPVDRGEWVMVPHLVNAVNLPAMNALNFPAAILQPPNFDPSWPDQMNYGAIGSVIGHEISHSFDDEGAEFDDTGRLKNWWTDDDHKHFKASGKQLIAQYSAYKPFPDVAVNGAQTINENIADVAGLSVAYDAYRLANGGKEGAAVAGLSGDQQFFIAFGQAWRSEQREASLRQRLVVDVHAPAEYRADTVRNLDPWYDAFHVQPGDRLYLTPEQRVKVW
jgi:putative endopeptidase